MSQGVRKGGRGTRGGPPIFRPLLLNKFPQFVQNFHKTISTKHTRRKKINPTTHPLIYPTPTERTFQWLSSICGMYVDKLSWLLAFIKNIL